MYCPHNKQIEPILQAIEACDGMIFAASSYQGALPAIAKNFTDHLAFLLHRPRFFTKKALIITTTGAVGGKSLTKSVAATLPGWGFNRCYRLSVAAYSWNDYKPSMKDRDKAKRVTIAFYQDVKSKKLHAPSFGVLIPFNLFQAICKTYAPGMKYESQDGVFWKQYEGMRYAKDVPMPFYKRAFAWLICQVGKAAGKKITITYKK
ncbi:MAG: NADPH-dependent oxidoreductase [Lachnospiraceae bacterium]|nr:NADPH-dependent oxidoreductase [Lachnospiraceae bacterium]